MDKPGKEWNTNGFVWNYIGYLISQFQRIIVIFSVEIVVFTWDIPHFQTQIAHPFLCSATFSYISYRSDACCAEPHSRSPAWLAAWKWGLTSAMELSGVKFSGARCECFVFASQPIQVHTSKDTCHANIYIYSFIYTHKKKKLSMHMLYVLQCYMI